jgi:hypothetical protein
MASKAPPVHSFNAVEARGRVGFWKISTPQGLAARLKVSRRQAEKVRNNRRGYIATRGNTTRAAHDYPAKSLRSHNPSWRV